MLSWLRKLGLKLTVKHKRTLRALDFDEGSPGTVLRDFDTLLSFVRGRDFGLSKTYHLLPRNLISITCTNSRTATASASKSGYAIRSSRNTPGRIKYGSATYRSTLVSRWNTCLTLATDGSLKRRWNGWTHTRRLWAYLCSWTGAARHRSSIQSGMRKGKRIAKGPGRRVPPCAPPVDN